MVHKHVIEAIDKTLRDIMKSVDPSLKDKSFGGKCLVFGGDWRQILPVVKHGSESDAINACLFRSNLWKNIKLLKLTINQRVVNNPSTNNSGFAEFLLKVGEAKTPYSSEIISLPESICSKSTSLENYINELQPLSKWTIVASKNEDVDEINNLLMTKFEGEEHTYFSSNTLVDNQNERQFTEEFLASLQISGK